LAVVAEALAQAGDLDRAWQAATDAEQAARSLTTPYEQAHALSAVLRALASAGKSDRARAVATDAERVARSITDTYERARALAEVLGALVQAGELDRAESAACSITSPHEQASALKTIFAVLNLQRSRKILAAVLVTSDPVALLNVAAMIAPQAVVETAQYVYQP
ncbi:hypothetical protein, partial [Actinomadura luteofluorescens]